MIYISDIRHIDKNADEIWAIVRNNKSNLGILVPEFAPSQGLYSWYWETKQNNNWNEETFKSIYVPRFIKEFTAQGKLKLKELGHMDKAGKYINLFCYCSDQDLCHRSIIAGILQGMKCDVKISNDYSYYYDMFLEVHGKNKERK